MTELYDDCNFKNKPSRFDGSKTKWQEFDEAGQHGPITDAKLSVAGDLCGNPYAKLPPIGSLFQQMSDGRHQFPAYFRSVENREKTKTTYFQPKTQ